MQIARTILDWTPLHIASEYGHDHVTALLLDQRRGRQNRGVDDFSDTVAYSRHLVGKIAVVDGAPRARCKV